MYRFVLTITLGLFMGNTISGNVEAGWLDDLKKLGDDAVETVNEVGKAVEDALTEEEIKTQPAETPATLAPTQEVTPAVVTSAPTALKSDIKQAQTLLNSLGYDAGTADGLMGKKTRAAIRTFQKDNVITQDGTVSASLLVKLQESLPQTAGGGISATE